jgi:hypothetical protein
MKRSVYTFHFLVLLFASLGLSGYSQKKIMFIGAAADLESATYQSEIDLFDSLKVWGFAPTYWASADIQAGGLDAFYPDYDGIFITEWLGSSSIVNIGADGYKLPIVNLEGFAPRSDRWGWIDDNTTEFYQTTAEMAGVNDDYIIIKDNTHYITKNFKVNDEVAWTTGANEDPTTILSSSSKEVNTMFSHKLAISKAHSTMDGFWTMVAIDKGVLPNKVFSWGMLAQGLDNGTLDVHDGTPAFYKIIKRACEWAYDKMDVTAIEDVKHGVFDMAAYPNPGHEMTLVRYSSPVYGKSDIRLFNSTGQCVASFKQDVIAGSNYLELRVSDYTPGIYHLGIAISNHSESIKLMIQ